MEKCLVTGTLIPLQELASMVALRDADVLVVEQLARRFGSADVRVRIHQALDPEKREGEKGPHEGKLGELSVRIMTVVRDATTGVNAKKTKPGLNEIRAAFLDGERLRIAAQLCYLTKRRFLKHSGAEGNYRYEPGERG